MFWNRRKVIMEIILDVCKLENVKSITIDRRKTVVEFFDKPNIKNKKNETTGSGTP